MVKKGQIVEIPASSHHYTRDDVAFLSKKEQLQWKNHQRNYSLFDGFLVGEHNGTTHFKIGQRKGINVGGKAKPLYVIAIDNAENRLFVGEGDSHPGLLTAAISFSEKEIRWTDYLRLSKTNFNEELPIDVHSCILDHPISGVLYTIDNLFFLEFLTEIPVNIEDYPIDLSYENEIIAQINIIN